jgi:hypothetical protein
MEPEMKHRLLKLRETQGKTAPNMCLGSSKFVALKLIGLIQESKHLNDFLRSAWAKENQSLSLKNAWGWTVTKYNSVFNDKVLRAAASDPRGGVKSPDVTVSDIEFQYFTSDIKRADKLLMAHVPLVVGVGISGGTGRQHFVTVFSDSKKDVWVIDPWGDQQSAVYKLPADFSFGKPRTLPTELEDRFPCSPPWFGYFRDSDLESKYAFPISMEL